MEILPVLRMLGALGVVLGLLAGALWAVRRFQIRLPGVAGTGGPTRRLELVERVSMDTRRSVALVRRDGREHLLLLAPEGNMVIETGIQLDDADREAARIRAEQAEQAAADAAEAACRVMDAADPDAPLHMLAIARDNLARHVRRHALGLPRHHAA